MFEVCRASKHQVCPRGESAARSVGGEVGRNADFPPKTTPELLSKKIMLVLLVVNEVGMDEYYPWPTSAEQSK